uniref:Uncharacterized protein LOC114345824 n=1 Tax=Diabrotica virgifera virgifera TaxID=50390 RepID=A0A6P7GSB0_DIAVI
MDSIVDWVTIKTFDVYNILLSEVENTTVYTFPKDYDWKKEDLNREAIIRSWLGAGLSKNKLIMGFDLYGIKFTFQDGTQSNRKDQLRIDRVRYDEICPDLLDYYQTHFGTKRDLNTETTFVDMYNYNQLLGWNDAYSTFSKVSYYKLYPVLKPGGGNSKARFTPKKVSIEKSPRYSFLVYYVGFDCI